MGIATETKETEQVPAASSEFSTPDLSRFTEKLVDIDPIRLHGKVTQVVGLVIEATSPAVSVGDLCYIYPRDGDEPIHAEVVGFRGKNALLMPLGDMRGIGPQSIVVPSFRSLSIKVDDDLLGRVIDSVGAPIDDKGPLKCRDEYPLFSKPINPLDRRRINEPLATGVKAIDACLTCGRGQRVGIFSGSGIGKSTLLGMIARHTEADVNVIGLVGERGREVKDFIEEDLGERGLARSVVVAVTSDQPALLRLQGAYVATTVAEYFRDRGMDVLLMMDSVTRLAMAQRQVGLAIGEPPTTRGYPPSVYALLPQLLERAGTSPSGSITGIYAVLVEADDMNEPISDAVRSILDGHIVLSRDLASRNHYPAIDILQSVSRVMVDVVSKRHTDVANQMRKVLATYREAEDLINIGAYVDGSNPDIDYARQKIAALNRFLIQNVEDHFDFEHNIPELERIFCGDVVLPTERAAAQGQQGA
jgi:flagellum-specific ATP synthase